MKALIIVLACFLAVAYSKAINAKCEPQRFDKCTDTFAKALGLPQMPTDASVLDKQIKDIIAKEGAAGQKRVCDYDRNLQSCFGDEYSSCVSVDFLKSIGESEADAKQFVALAQQLVNTCKSSSFAVNAKCDLQRLSVCAAIFAQALGLKYMPTDPSVLDKQIKDIIAKEGAAGQKRICDYDRNLQTCIGDEYDSCVSVDFLKSIGESEADAKQFVAIAQQLVNTCKSSTSFAVNAKCEPQRFDKCTDTFAKALGLPQMPTDASVLDKQIKDIVTKEGAAGQKRVCEAAGNLQQCLGDEYDSCISVDFLKSIGESEADAKKFVALANQLLATCKATASLLLSQAHLFNPNVLLGCNNIACNSCMVTCQLTGGTADKCQPSCDGMFGCKKCN